MTDLLYLKASEVKSQLRSIIKPAFVLFVICFMVTAALSITYAITKEPIAERAKLDEENARREVLTDVNDFIPIENLDDFSGKNQKLGIIKEAYKGIKDEAVTGYVYLVESKGYGGIMKITVGVNINGEITGVKIGENSETQGLGSKTSDNKFLSQFHSKPTEPLKVIKSEKKKNEEIVAVSGATKSSKAVTNAVQAAVDMTAELIKEEGNKNE